MRRKILPLFLLICILGCTQDREPPLSAAIELEDTKSSTDAIPPQETDTADERATFRLASWNIRIFSDNSRNDAELAQICEILSRYDFIAIVELRDEAVLRRAEVINEKFSTGNLVQCQVNLHQTPPLSVEISHRSAVLNLHASVFA
jgi:hypothetical protein